MEVSEGRTGSTGGVVVMIPAWGCHPGEDHPSGVEAGPGKKDARVMEREEE